MKTYNERLKRIQKKARRMKWIRFGINSGVATVCLAVIVMFGMWFGPHFVNWGNSLFMPTGSVYEQPSGLSHPSDTFSQSLSTVTPQPTTLPKAYENQEVTIQLAHAMSNLSEELLQSYIVEFNKIYPNIHINLANYGDAAGLYGSLSMVNSNTDLVLCLEDNAVRLQEKLDNLVNLESLIYSEAVVIRGDYSTEKLGLTAQQKDALYTVCLESCRLTEREDVYSLPFYQLPEVMYYNKTYFEANDLQVPQSWDAVWETAVRIQAKGDPVTPLSVVYPHKLFATLMRQNYVPVQNQFGSFNYDYVAVEQFVVEFAKQYSYGCWSDTSGFSLERNAMVLDRCVGGNTFASSDGSYEVGVAPVPQVDGDNPQTWTQNASFCILDHNDALKVMASWLFMKFLATDPQIQADFSMKTGFLPVNREAVALPEYQLWLASANGYDNVTALAAKCALEQLDSYFSVQNIPRAYSSLKNVSQAFCMTSNVTDETVLAYYRQLYRDYVRTEPEKPSPIIPEMFVGTGEGFSCKPQYFIASWKDPYGEVYQVKDHPMQKDMQSLFDPNSDYQIVSVTTDYLAVGMGWTTEPTEVEITCWDIQYHGLTNYAKYAESPEWTGDQLKLAPGTYLYVVKCYWENDGQVDAYGKVEYAFIATCSTTGAESDGLQYERLSDGTYGVGLRNSSHRSEIVIPSTYNGVPVTQILEYGFANATQLVSVTIGEGISYIGCKAFSGCSSLTSIVIPKSVTHIEAYAFEHCSSLVSIDIPDSVTKMNTRAFSWCTSLEKITIPKGVSQISDDLFLCCTSLTSIVIPEGVTLIGEAAFNGCENLTSVVIPDSVTSMAERAFGNCVSLNDIVLPSKITRIEDGLFNGCSSLTKITIPDGVTYIGVGAFLGCENLTELTIPDSVTQIGRIAFFGCGKLTSIILPNGITSIPESMLSGCYELSSITIPEGVTSIGKTVFWVCSKLASITLPKTLTIIEDEALYACMRLSRVFFNGTVDQWNAVTKGTNWDASISDYLVCCTDGVIHDGVIYEEHGTEGLAYELLTDGTYGVKIGNALEQSSIVIPSVYNAIAVTQILPEGFASASYLVDITIPGSVTTIGNGAFKNCAALRSIVIPNTVESIGEKTFLNCTSLAVVTLSGKLNRIPVSAFENCTSLVNVVIPSYVFSIDQSAFSGCTSLESITLPKGIVTIGSAAFENCSNLAISIFPTVWQGSVHMPFLDVRNCLKLPLPPSCKA